MRKVIFWPSGFLFIIPLWSSSTINFCQTETLGFISFIFMTGTLLLPCATTSNMHLSVKRINTSKKQIHTIEAYHHTRFLTSHSAIYIGPPPQQQSQSPRKTLRPNQCHHLKEWTVNNGILGTLEKKTPHLKANVDVETVWKRNIIHPLTFHYTGWLIGILIMAYNNPHIIG